LHPPSIKEVSFYSSLLKPMPVPYAHCGVHSRSYCIHT